MITTVLCYSATLGIAVTVYDTPCRVDMGNVGSYDRVIANPPFSLKNWGHDFAPNDPHHRFDRYGAIPPRTRGDLAFLLHMLGVTNSTAAWWAS